MSATLFERENPTCNGCSVWFSYCILISDYFFLLDLVVVSFYKALLNPLRRKGGAFEWTHKALQFKSFLRSGVYSEVLDRVYNTHHLQASMSKLTFFGLQGSLFPRALKCQVSEEGVLFTLPMLY